MKRSTWIATLVVLVVTVARPAGAQVVRVNRPVTVPARVAAADKGADPVALGHPLSYWIAAIAARDKDRVEMAFDAIVDLGPAARKAVPELTAIVAAPFDPIDIDAETRAQTHAKLLDVYLRSGAVDALGAIGESAAPAAEAVIRWGLSLRVVAPSGRAGSPTLFVELVGMDVLERMRAAGAVARFGVKASDAVMELIDSGDNEKQKFAAAILSETTVGIAVDLMTSRSCADRAKGLALLAGMWPVVAKEHFAAFKDATECREPLKLDAREVLP